ncbi:MAG TPA: CUAEP/CCAEP-tail radical SAM protein [Blastocatellia bacterium]|nr:CUAEP/CCAEP-tail radical SAM protein [Blastocatellia bacterium]
MTQRIERSSILLVSCYELGHQPAGIAMPLGFLRREGIDAESMDVSVEGFDPDKIKRARLIGISVPMHTALRLGLRVAREARKLNPECHICFYGLYAVLNAEYLLKTVADSVIGGEFEEALTLLIKAVDARGEIDIDGVSTRNRLSKPILTRLDFAVPERSSLVPLEHYAKLECGGEERLAGYVEASRGCLHQCTHCPIPPVYGGRFFTVPVEIVLGDIRRLVASGARHVTFGDPDFLNGPGHSTRLARAMHEEFPDLTFDFTAKIEHVLKHRRLIPELAALGCVFAVSAVESLSNIVLERLDKGHTRDDVFEALQILREAGIAMRPSFVPFTPWTTIDDYIDILEFVESQGLIDHIDPVQYSIRLLVPPGSVLLSREETGEWLGRLNEEGFSYEWRHPDQRIDALQRQISALVEDAAARNEDSAATFNKIRDLAFAVRGDDVPAGTKLPFEPLRLRPPRLTEAWFC